MIYDSHLNGYFRCPYQHNPTLVYYIILNNIPSIFMSDVNSQCRHDASHCSPFATMFATVQSASALCWFQAVNHEGFLSLSKVIYRSQQTATDREYVHETGWILMSVYFRQDQKWFQKDLVKRCEAYRSLAQLFRSCFSTRQLLQFLASKTNVYQIGQRH